MPNCRPSIGAPLDWLGAPAWCAALLASLMTITAAQAQQVQFPSTSPNQWNGLAPNYSAPAPSLPNTGWQSTATLNTAPGTVLPNSGFVPNAGAATLPSPSFGQPSTTYGPATVTPLGPPVGTVPYGTAPSLNNQWNYGMQPGVYPNSTPPALFPGNSGFTNPFGGTIGGTPNMGSSNSIFPESWVNGNNWRLGSGWFNNPNGTLLQNPQQVTRFFVGPRFRHTWIAGDDQPGDEQPQSLEINDTEASLVFAIPKFLGTTQPLFVVPSFSNHLWEGPSTPTADLPGSAYSAFLDLGWDSDPMRTFGLESGIRLGVFTDYDTFNSDSFRIQGKLFGRVRLTPTATGKLGVYWIDRNRIKLVPAGGIIWTPNPDTKFDLFFPEPKLAHYLATLGRADTWWYATGYFGGGTWTITRADGVEDSVDINDIRIMVGLEFGKNEELRVGRRVGFVEAGYSFNRELIYRVRPQDNTDIEDSFVLRAGIGY